MKKIVTVFSTLMAFALSAEDVNQLTDAVGITWHMSAVSGAAPEWYTDIGVERFVKNDGSAYVTEISIPTTVTLLTVPSKLEWLSHGVAFSAYPVIKYLTRSATEGHPYITSVAVNRSVELEMPCFKNCPSLERFGLGNPPDWDSGEVREGSLYAVKDGVLYNGDMSELMKYPEGKLGAVFTVPASVVKVHQFSLVNMRLAGITFEGNAPEIIQDMDDSLETVSSTVVSGSSNLSKIFYHQDAFGWGRTWCGVQTQMILDPVTGLTATKGSRSDGVLLTWNGNEKASGYRIYRTEDESRIFLAEAWDTTLLDETADPKKTYWYDVEVLGGDDWGRACVSEPCQSTVGWAAEPTFEFSDVCGFAGDAGPSGVCLLNCTCAGGRLVIPSEHDGWPVIAISPDACCYKHISEVTIPPSVRYIERSAFQGCSALTSVTIPSGVIGISANAFRFCRGLISIQVSEDNAVYSSLDGVLFSKDGTKLLIYPEGKNGPYDIPLAVKDIGDDAFYACSGLTSVTIPSSVTSIGRNAFYGCSELGNGVVIVDNCVLTVNGTCPPNVVLPDGIRLIAGEAFSSCGDLASMMIPESVTGIGGGAFLDCSGLTNVVLSSSLTNIEAGMFNGCSGLTSVMIPKGVTNIGGWAFANCSGLTHLSLPEGLRSVGSCAFQDCSGLTNIAIPHSVVSIGISAFSGCSGLGEGVVIVDGCALTVNGGCPAEVTFPEGTRLISDYMFHDFDELSAVTLPSSVVNLGNGAFAGCSSLTKVTFAEGLTSIGDRAFMDCRHLPSIAIPSSVKDIGNYAFSTCTALASVTISEGVESLGECAFESCDSLTRVHLPSSLRSLGKGAFVICYNLIDVVFENGVTNIGDLAFWWCHELKSVTIPASVTEIGDMAFEECFELTDLTIPEGVERIGELAFFACDRLKTVTIPASVTEIGDCAFGESLRLRNLIFLGNAPSVSRESPSDDESIVASVYTDAPEWDGCEDIVATVYADTTGWGEGDRWHGLILNRIERGSIVVRGKAACEIMPEGLETSLEVPNDWLIENGVAKEGDAVADVAVRMAETGANGIPRYQSYILNMVPDADVSAEDQLKVTIDFDANGVPVIGYKPTPNDASHVTVRTLGAKALGDDWVEVKGNEVDYKFFKVAVGVR